VSYLGILVVGFVGGWLFARWLSARQLQPYIHQLETVAQMLTQQLRASGEAPATINLIYGAAGLNAEDK